MFPYANVRDVRFELRETTADVVVHDVQMLGFLRQSSERITNKLGMRFLPYLETKTFSSRLDKVTAKPWRIVPSKGLLLLPETLLAITLVTDGDGNPLTYQTDYVEDPPNQYPITALRLIGSGYPCSWGCKSWYATQLCSGEPSMTQVQGIWGMHRDYANAYTDTLDSVQDDPLTANSTTITVADVAGTDAYGRTPRFSPGQLLKIEDELVGVQSITMDVLRVVRGANGTTAVEHALDTDITVFEPDFAANQATLRWAAYPYKRRGDYALSTFDLNTGIATKLPFDAPGDVIGFLQEYMEGTQI